MNCGTHRPPPPPPPPPSRPGRGVRTASQPDFHLELSRLIVHTVVEIFLSHPRRDYRQFFTDEGSDFRCACAILTFVCRGTSMKVHTAATAALQAMCDHCSNNVQLLAEQPKLSALLGRFLNCCGSIACQMDLFEVPFCR